MSNGRATCYECGQVVIVVQIFTAGVKLELDPQPVVGGDYTIWPVSNNGRESLAWLAKPRPRKVSPPPDAPALIRKQWDGAMAARRRKWFVQHEHGLDAEQILERRRRSLGEQSLGA